MTSIRILSCAGCNVTVCDDGHVRWDFDTAELHECRILTPTADAVGRFLREGRPS